MDDIFDLDMALTVEYPNPNPNISSSISRPDQIIKSSESEKLAINNNIDDIYMMMPSVLSAVGVCTVCMEGFESSTDGGGGGGGGGQQVLCGHVYHANCITRWLSLHNSCPLCRSSIVSDDRKTTLSVTPN